MQINLKQTEIETALKMYIERRGISLTNTDVAISFTAGRKSAGLSAEVSIQEATGAKIPSGSDEQAVDSSESEEESGSNKEAVPVQASSSLFN